MSPHGRRAARAELGRTAYEPPPPHDLNTNGQHPLNVSPLKVDDEQRRLRAALAGLGRNGVVELCWVAGQSYGDLERALDQGPGHWPIMRAASS